MYLCVHEYMHVCMYECVHIYTCIQNLIPGNVSFNQEYLNDHRCERTNKAAN